MEEKLHFGTVVEEEGRTFLWWLPLNDMGRNNFLQNKPRGMDRPEGRGDRGSGIEIQPPWRDALELPNYPPSAFKAINLRGPLIFLHFVFKRNLRNCYCAKLISIGIVLPVDCWLWSQCALRGEGKAYWDVNWGEVIVCILDAFIWSEIEGIRNYDNNCMNID